MKSSVSQCLEAESIYITVSPEKDRADQIKACWTPSLLTQLDHAQRQSGIWPTCQTRPNSIVWNTNLRESSSIRDTVKVEALLTYRDSCHQSGLQNAGVSLASLLDFGWLWEGKRINHKNDCSTSFLFEPRPKNYFFLVFVCIKFN